MRDETLVAISNIDDKTVKSILLAMLGMIEEIGTRINQMRADERGLREVVLNGYEPVHHEHHEWVAAKIAEEKRAAAEADELRRAGRKALVEQFWRNVIIAAFSLTAGAWGALHLLK